MSTEAAEQPNPKVARYWRHKTSKKEVKVAPWWEILDPIVALSAEESMTSGLSDVKRQIKMGLGVECLVQVGWLIENEHNMFLGVGLAAQEQFEDITNERRKRLQRASVKKTEEAGKEA